MRQTRFRLLIVMALAVPALVVALPALAQYPPGQDEALTCSNVEEGDEATCSAGGLEPGSEAEWTATAATRNTQAMAPLATIGLTLAQGREVIGSGTATADEDGFITFDFSVPEDARSVQVRVTGTAANGTPYVAAEAIPVQSQRPAPGGVADDPGAPAADGLASTGEMVSLLLIAGVLALGVGVVAVRRGRTRETTSV